MWDGVGWGGVGWDGVGWGECGSVRRPLSTPEHINMNVKASGDMRNSITVYEDIRLCIAVGH